MGTGGCTWLGPSLLLFMDTSFRWGMGIFEKWGKSSPKKNTFILTWSKAEAFPKQLFWGRAVQGEQTARLWECGKGGPNLLALQWSGRDGAPTSQDKAPHIRPLAFLASFPSHNLLLSSLRDTQIQLDHCGVCGKNSPFCYFFYLNGW